MSHHRFGGLVRCPCGGRMRPFAPTARPGYVSYRCYRASTLPGHVFPAAMNEKYLNVFWVVEMSRSYVMPVEVGQEDVLAAAKERRSRLIPLYDGGQIPKEELDARWAELTAEIDELEGADTPRMQAAREASMRELLERMYDPALFNVHLRKLWDSVECSVVNGKMVPVKVNWKDGIRPGPIDEGIAKVNARDAFTIGWFQHLGWLETPPAPPV